MGAAGLDDRGGELATNLRTLYTYILSRLLKASRDNDPALLDEVRRLLEQVSTAWTQIGPGRQPVAAPAMQRATVAVR